ncbi:fructosamine kinase family protein [Thiospirillum jenense]|uniref:Fructosamine kinase family protein n=1 Tax=Thiospirillum jenense TaxID=1653858 RepID=A0A839HG50_9GAMM|nr:fructosamine kinase family protein [Thiospirillum jenense]MBB1125312.1 fructosamine kinase family protein [Thiospirillum jenense]
MTIHWEDIAAEVFHITGTLPGAIQVSEVGGGCINTAAILRCGQATYFIKCNRAALLPMFIAESAGLTTLATAGVIRVPQPIGTGTIGNTAWIAMEHVVLHRRANDRALALAGEQLAALHQVTHSQYGWHQDNTIGATPQYNQSATDWVQFWREQRLGLQLKLAAANGYKGQLQERGNLLLEQLPMLINHNPVASLLHGDLWNGNLGYDVQEQPVLFDPAVYYGDRETDLAMTELFGGFSTRFYAAYRATWPLPVEYNTRRYLYQLYHILNHLNLFGYSYLGQAEDMINRLLAECH